MASSTSGRLADKVAVITGAASGIGLGTLELFVAEGAKVVAADIQDEKGAALRQRFPQQVRYVHCDVTQEADISAAVATATSEFGRLDVMFNNAGISDRMTEISDLTVEGWDWIYSILVRGVMLGIKHAAAAMGDHGGSIINTASVAALQAGYGPIAYSSAKAAVLHLSRVAAPQLAAKNIRVNAICPGLIATSIFGASVGLARDSADQMAAYIATHSSGAQPLRQGGLPEDIGRAALFLASDDSRFMTGGYLVVDGGLTTGPRHAWDLEGPSPFAEILGDLYDPGQRPA